MPDYSEASNFGLMEF